MGADGGWQTGVPVPRRSPPASDPDFAFPPRDPSLTSTGFLSARRFMSPGDVGLLVDGRSDPFSPGCVMYMMLTGELPFPAIP